MKKSVYPIMLSIVCGFLLAACGSVKTSAIPTPSAADTYTPPVSAAPESLPVPSPKEQSDTKPAPSPSAPAETPPPSVSPQEQAAPDSGTHKVTAVCAETDKNGALERAVVEAIGFPSDDSVTSTRYYYNFVDLNGDGTDEIFVELVGPYTSGSGGDTGLLFTKESGAFVLLQKMTLVWNPVIVDEKTTNGWHDLIMTTAGGGDQSERVRLRFDGDRYPNPGDGEVLKPDDLFSGTAIISNDIAKEFQEGKGLYLSAQH